MARMYPNQLDPDTESPAERLLYQSFREGLDDSYTVFHSVAWQALDGNRRRRDGEADFVIAHPDRGILVLEVKGGGIEYDAQTRRWYSRSGDGRLHSIHDPFVQARTSKYTLRDLLAGMSGSPDYPINLGHAVAFPDVLVGAQFLGPDRTREIVLDRSDLINLSGWVGACLAYWRGELHRRESAPTGIVVSNLMSILGRSWELRPKLWGDFLLEQNELIRLTEEQYRLLSSLNRHRRAAICGCAGSGKTMLAVEKAVRLAQQGFKTLLTCYNKNLAADLRASVGTTDNLDIVHFHELCHQWAERAEMVPEGPIDTKFFEVKLPDALLAALDVLPDRYDAIVVDEGQDFCDNYWLPLQYLLHDPDHGILYIFYDDNQRLYVPSGTFPIQSPPVGLTVNCRNTQRVHQVVVRFYEAESYPDVLGPQGRPVELVRYTDAAGLRAELLAYLERLVHEESVPTDEIAVLGFTNKRIRQFWSDEWLSMEWPPAPGKVHCSTVHAFKGLERAVIVLAGLEGWMPENFPNLDQVLYVGASRARNHLAVLITDEAIQVLGGLFK